MRRSRPVAKKISISSYVMLAITDEIGKSGWLQGTSNMRKIFRRYKGIKVQSLGTLAALVGGESHIKICLSRLDRMERNCWLGLAERGTASTLNRLDRSLLLHFFAVNSLTGFRGFYKRSFLAWESAPVVSTAPLLAEAMS